MPHFTSNLWHAYTVYKCVCDSFKGSGGGATVTREDKVKQILDEIIEKLPEEFNMVEIMNKVEERTPYALKMSDVVNIYRMNTFVLSLGT